MKTELLEGLTLEPGNPIGAKSRAQAGPKGNDKQSALEVTVEGDMERKPGGGSEHGALYPCLPGSIHSSPLPCVTGAGSPLSLGPLQATFLGQVPGSSEALPSRMGWLGGGSPGVSAHTGG